MKTRDRFGGLIPTRADAAYQSARETAIADPERRFWVNAPKGSGTMLESRALMGDNVVGKWWLKPEVEREIRLAAGFLDGETNSGEKIWIDPEDDSRYFQSSGHPLY
jgi:hypothetical protein